jgi:hypothetical protein
MRGSANCASVPAEVKDLDSSQKKTTAAAPGRAHGAVRAVLPSYVVVILQIRTHDFFDVKTTKRYCTCVAACIL